MDEMKAATATSAASAHARSVGPWRPSKQARARSAGPTKFATLKMTMYQRGRERTDSGKNATAIATAARTGGRISTAAKIGARER
jgi:hypothetical protein